MFNKIIPLTALIFSINFSCTMDQKVPSKISYFHNGTIYSMDESSNVYSAMIVEDGRIKALGGDEIKDQIQGNDFKITCKFTQPWFPNYRSNQS